MFKNLRISVFALTGAVAGFVLQGCFAPQPTPECTVTITSAAFGLTPYYVLLTPKSGTGSCAQLTHMSTGLQRYRTQPIGGAFTLGVKSSPVADPYFGYSYEADVDESNNCINEDDCLGEADPSAVCVINAADGGVETYDGTPVNGDQAEPQDGGAAFTIDPANECVAVVEPVERVDPTDPEGKNLNAIGQMPQFPTNGVCTVTDFVGGSQTYEPVPLVDGTSLPEVTHKVEYANFNVINSTKVPGTAFTADVTYTEGGCVAEYAAVGFWPEVQCAADEDCDPNADLDAGRVFGSGVNPEFKPTCNMDLGVCVPTVDVTTIQ